jgi:hypothetical protein
MVAKYNSSSHLSPRKLENLYGRLTGSRHVEPSDQSLFARSLPRGSAVSTRSWNRLPLESLADTGGRKEERAQIEWRGLSGLGILVCCQVLKVVTGKGTGSVILITLQ